MAHKTYIDGGNKAIAYQNDTEPLRVYVDGELQTDVSYISQKITGKSSVTYESEYKKNLLSMEIQGKTEQKCFEGKNLIDIDKFIELIQQYDTVESGSQIVEVDGKKYIRFAAHLMAGKDFTACCPAFENNTRYIFSFYAKPYTLVSEDSEYNGALYMGYKGLSSSQMTGVRDLSGKTTTEFTRMYAINSEGTTVTDISLSFGSAHRWLIDLDTVYLYKYENNDNPEYEPYVGGIQSPNPSYPQPIQNTGDNGLEVEVRGINLLNEELFLLSAYVNKVGDEYQFLGYPCTYNSYVGNEELVVAFKNTIKPDVKYTICSQFSSRSSASSAGAFQLRDSVSGGNLIYGFYNNSNVGAIKLDVFSLTQEQLDSIQNIWIYGTTQANIDAGYKPTIGRFMILEGEYTLDTLPPFEPYFEPQTVTIPTTLCGIDGYNDSLTVDWLNKTVKKNTKILYARVSDLIDAGNAIIAPSELDGITYYAIAINDVPMWIGSIDGGETASNYYCTHCLTYHNSQIETGTLICELYNGYDGTDNTSLWFYYIEQSTVEDFRAWADENNVMIAYILKYESVEDISSDLLSLTDYTQNQTNIIEIIPNNDVNASSLTVEYAKWEGDVND